MLPRLANVSYRRRRLTVAGWLVALILLTVVAGSAGSSWSQSFHNGGTDSQAATDLLQSRFPAQAGSSADIVFKAGRGLQDPATHRRLDDLFAQVAKVPQVGAVASPFAPGDQHQISADGTVGYAQVHVTADQTSVTKATKERLTALVRAANSPGCRSTAAVTSSPLRHRSVAARLSGQPVSNIGPPGISGMRASPVRHRNRGGSQRAQPGC